MLDLIIYNGVIRTLDSTNSVHEAIGIKDGRIVKIGKNEEIEKLQAKNKININKKLVLPGFVDTHLHALDYAEMKGFVDLREIESIEKVIEKAKKHYEIKGLYQGWLIGWGWNQNSFKDGHDFIYKEDLDKISKDYPIIFTRACVHAAVVNSKALELILETEEAKKLSEHIDKEKGILKESSLTIYRKLLEKPQIEDIKQMILIAHEDFLKEGITQVHTADFFSAVPEEQWEKVIKAYEELDKEEKLNVRTYEQCMFFNYKNFENFLNKGYKTTKGTQFFKIGPLKLISDGSLGARTALMKEPYTDDKTTVGIQTLSTDEIKKFIKKAKENDMQLAIHCIGDAAIDNVADLLNDANKTNLSNPMRDGIVHVQITNDEIFEKMKKGNITAYIQPVFIEEDMKIAEIRLGEKRISTSYAWKTMLDKGILTTGGSDAPVASFNVLENIYYAVTRKNKEGNPSNGWLSKEKITVDQAVKIFTKNSSYQSFEEDVKGTLEVNKYADLVILEKDIYSIPEDEIKNVKVEYTIVNGKIVYNKIEN